MISRLIRILPYKRYNLFVLILVLQIEFSYSSPIKDGKDTASIKQVKSYDLSDKWAVFLDHKKKTCLIDIPFTNISNTNVKVVLKMADSVGTCQLAATKISDAEYFFWSENPNPLGTSQKSNCYVFKSCIEKDYTSLKFPGNTYQRVCKDSLSHFKTSSRIIAGNKAGSPNYPHPIPWQVGLVLQPYVDKVFCGGALLSDKYILSAAHCKDNLRFNNKDQVFIGEFSKRDGHKKHKLSEIHFIHPKYEVFQDKSMDIMINDFMLLTLIKPLKSVCPTTYAKLPSNDMDEHYLTDKVLTASGWGNTKRLTREQVINSFPDSKNYAPLPTHLPESLLVTELSYLSNDICQRRHQDFFSEHKDTIGTLGTHAGNLNFERTSGSSMLCASMCPLEDLSKCASWIKTNNKPSFTGTCVGDSGGPLVYIDPNDPNRIATLIGIVSWGGACGYAEWPDVHGRVTSALNWINEKIFILDQLN